MKYNTATPPLPHLHLGDIQNNSSVEWSPQYFISQEQTRNLKVSPPSPSSETRRISARSISSSTSSSISSNSLSSSSSYYGFGTYDDPDDITSETSTNEVGDPIISFEALSLETRRTTGSVTPTSTLSPSEEDDHKLHHKDKHPIEHLGRMEQTRLPQCQELSPDPLNLATSFKKGGMSRRSYPEKQSMFSLLAPKKSQQQHESWNINELVTSNAVPCAESLRSEQEQRRSIVIKKYAIKNTTAVVSSNLCSLPAPSANESPGRALRSKRQRGGSDFSMLSEGNSATLSSPTDRRKRRRVNRNRAMAADEFDSILSQINTTGSL